MRIFPNEAPVCPYVRPQAGCLGEITFVAGLTQKWDSPPSRKTFSPQNAIQKTTKCRCDSLKRHLISCRGPLLTYVEKSCPSCDMNKHTERSIPCQYESYHHRICNGPIHLENGPSEAILSYSLSSLYFFSPSTPK